MAAFAFSLESQIKYTMIVRVTSSVLVVALTCLALASAGPGFRDKFKTMDNPYVTLYANEYYRGEWERKKFSL